jgi:hypothetical protein
MSPNRLESPVRTLRHQSYQIAKCVQAANQGAIVRLPFNAVQLLGRIAERVATNNAVQVNCVLINPRSR